MTYRDQTFRGKQVLGALWPLYLILIKKSIDRVNGYTDPYLSHGFLPDIL
jgi:hypothetical protein